MVMRERKRVCECGCGYGREPARLPLRLPARLPARLPISSCAAFQLPILASHRIHCSLHTPQHFPPPLSQALFDIVDTDKSGSINYVEFVPRARDVRASNNEEEKREERAQSKTRVLSQGR